MPRNQCSELRLAETYHLTYASNIVITTTDKPNKRLPSILPQYSDSCKFGRLFFEVCVRLGPLFIQSLQIRLEVQVVSQKFLRTVIFTLEFGLQVSWYSCSIVQMSRVLSERKQSAMNSTRPGFACCGLFPPKRLTATKSCIYTELCEANR